ncbi:uncharacterized protein BX664DRAFT_340541 [Halteromyces radiatus]|uniref:uncharacterized protein n=1 Tax=Halteromyces radiatus TaxID=101107 RepID=UPI00221E8B01|nr:uncharacterized protein BX664DRAFT_340541 [Halteromyces radiatus]KAI8081500.1 hypothetical protein BX664DRAFT_340541 [Halteromyces radiatus]
MSIHNILSLLLFLYLTSSVLCCNVDYEYNFLTTTQPSTVDNKTIDIHLYCSIDDLPPPTSRQQPIYAHTTTAKARSRLHMPSSKFILEMIHRLQVSTKQKLATAAQQMHHLLNVVQQRLHQVEYDRFITGTVVRFYQSTGYMIRTHLQPTMYEIRHKLWPLMYGLNDRKEDMVQFLEDIYTHPALEWHIFSSKLTGQLRLFMRHLGMDSFLQHIHQQLLRLLSNSLFSTRINSSNSSPPFSNLDDLFKDMLETDYHGKFYKQQMARYYQQMSPQEQTQVLYSKRDFTQWVKDGASQTHNFVVQTQQDWIQLMQSLYHDMESMLDCLSLPPPDSLMTTIDCSPKIRRQALLLLSPPSSATSSILTTDSTGSSSTSSRQIQSTTSTTRQRYEWIFELEQIYQELEITIECICPSNHHQHSDQTFHPSSSPFSKSSTPHIIKYKQNHPQQQQQQRQQQQQQDEQQYQENHTTHRQLSIDMLANLKKTMMRRFARLDKELHRQFFAATPPRKHQPMHSIYNRLRENVSAMNKSTYDKYLNQLILSWTAMMANTLDMANSVADDLIWLQRKKDDNRTNNVYAESIELIWTSAQRKMDKNNEQLINQWELIFIDLDHDLQLAWLEMLDMVDETHRSSLERVKSFWLHNKARLSHFFSSLFQPTHLMIHQN